MDYFNFVLIQIMTGVVAAPEMGIITGEAEGEIDLEIVQEEMGEEEAEVGVRTTV